MLSWSDIYRIGLGYLGLSEEELENSTFVTFNYRYEGYMEREYIEWDRTRTLALFLLQPHLGKNSKLTPRDLLPLPIDNKPETQSQEPQFTDEQRRIIEEARKRYEQSRN